MMTGLIRKKKSRNINIVQNCEHREDLSKLPLQSIRIYFFFILPWASGANLCIYLYIQSEGVWGECVEEWVCIDVCASGRSVRRLSLQCSFSLTRFRYEVQAEGCTALLFYKHYWYFSLPNSLVWLQCCNIVMSVGSCLSQKAQGTVWSHFVYCDLRRVASFGSRGRSRYSWKGVHRCCFSLWQTLPSSGQADKLSDSFFESCPKVAPLCQWFQQTMDGDDRTAMEHSPTIDTPCKHPLRQPLPAFILQFWGVLCPDSTISSPQSGRQAWLTFGQRRGNFPLLVCRTFITDWYSVVKRSFENSVMTDLCWFFFITILLKGQFLMACLNGSFLKWALCFSRRNTEGIIFSNTKLCDTTAVYLFFFLCNVNVNNVVRLGHFLVWGL